MKKLVVCLLAFFCMTLTVMAYKYDYGYTEDDVIKWEKLTATQLRLAILERYNPTTVEAMTQGENLQADDLKKLIQLVFEKGSAKLQNRFCLALQYVLTTEAAVSAAARIEVANYALYLMKGNGFAYTAADGSYRIQIGNSKPTYEFDDDYKRVSEPATSL